MTRLIDESRMDKRVFSTGSLHDEPRDRAYWLSRPDTERLAGIEFMRQALYGYDPATARLQRVLEIAELGED
jgi:hypothetical protein